MTIQQVRQEIDFLQAILDQYGSNLPNIVANLNRRKQQLKDMTGEIKAVH